MNKMRMLGIIFFVAIVICDWWYIFALGQQAKIITHWVIVSPMMMTLFMALMLMTIGGVYLTHTWAFISSYLIIFFSAGFSIASYCYIDQSLMTDTFYLAMLMITNIAIVIYLIMVQMQASD